VPADKGDAVFRPSNRHEERARPASSSGSERYEKNGDAAGQGNACLGVLQGDVSLRGILIGGGRPTHPRRVGPQRLAASLLQDLGRRTREHAPRRRRPTGPVGQGDIHSPGRRQLGRMGSLETSMTFVSMRRSRISPRTVRGIPPTFPRIRGPRARGRREGDDAARRFHCHRVCGEPDVRQPHCHDDRMTAARVCGSPKRILTRSKFPAEEAHDRILNLRRTARRRRQVRQNAPFSSTR